MQLTIIRTQEGDPTQLKDILFEKSVSRKQVNKTSMLFFFIDQTLLKSRDI
jgi:hypothetical protein